jgi:hypothetical protein
MVMEGLLCWALLCEVLLQEVWLMVNIVFAPGIFAFYVYLLHPIGAVRTVAKDQV